MTRWDEYDLITTPADGDTALVHDVSETVVRSKMKRITWANIKAAIGAAPTTTAENDFQVGGTGGTAGTWIKKTLAEAKIILGIVAASTTAAGVVELTVASEINTGTSDTLAMTPDSYAGSSFGKRVIQLKLVDDATALAIGDGKLIFVITSELNGMNLVDADAMVSTVSSSGTPTFQIRNVTDSADMLSTAITIDANEKTSYTAATAPVIDTTHDDVATGDIIAIDKDVAGTGEKGDTIMLSFALP